MQARILLWMLMHEDAGFLTAITRAMRREHYLQSGQVSTTLTRMLNRGLVELVGDEVVDTPYGERHRRKHRVTDAGRAELAKKTMDDIE